jgi:alkylation response protein AidB-like acyl-CoA dehydrogenase
MRLRAVRRGDDWLINGDAGFVPNAPLAGLWLVHTDQGLFVLPRDAPGLNWRAPGTSGEQGLPWFTGSGAEVSFTDCAVPGGDRLRAPVEMERSLRQGNVLMAAVNLGLGRAAFEAAIAYAQLRVQGARPIIQHQAIGTKLAGVAMQLEAARNLIWKAAVGTLPLDAVARAFTAEHVHTAVENATECFGAMGVMRDMPMQKYVHDAMVFLHSGRSGMVDLFEVGESVAGFIAPVAAGSAA